jgi:hypothetical protein
MSEGSELGFPVKGSLKRVPFPTLVRQIADARCDGSLYLLSDKTKKVVFFEGGQPVFVRSNVLSECLGQILAREGLITQAQCEQTLEAIRRTGKKQGELLVEMGILSEGNLRYGLEAQLRHKLLDIFAWEEGRYQFKPGPTKAEFGLRVDAGAEGIIVTGILESYPEQRARRVLEPELERFPVQAREPATSIEILPIERHFLAGLDGSRSVRELIDDPKNAAPTPAALLYAALQAGVTTLQDRRGAAGPRPAAPADPARDRPDETFAPTFTPTNLIKSYEDTPLPGALPDRPSELPADDEEEVFAAVAAGEPIPHPEREVSEELVAAESEDVVDETFDEGDVELVADDDLEILDEEEEEPDEGNDGDAGDEDEPTDEAAETPGGLLGLADALEPDDDLMLGDDELPPLEGGDDLLGLDDLDEVDLPGAAAPAAAPDAEDPEVAGAMRFTEGEAALQSGDWGRAVELLEAAYEHGIDVAELHAMLAYARFQTAPRDAKMRTHALELLDYAVELNPNLDIVYAYRGAILHAQGDPQGARAALQQALDINPYCDTALELMDALG